MHHHAPAPDEPVPFTLTPKARAFLDSTVWAVHTAGEAVVHGALYLETAIGGAAVPEPRFVVLLDDGPYGPFWESTEWGCTECGAAYFGYAPADGLCAECREKPAPGFGCPCPFCQVAG